MAFTVETALSVLGVSPGTSIPEVKKAFRKLSRVYHPDMGGDHNEYSKIAAAYEFVLANGTESKSYARIAMGRYAHSSLFTFYAEG